MFFERSTRLENFSIKKSILLFIIMHRESIFDFVVRLVKFLSLSKFHLNQKSQIANSEGKHCESASPCQSNTASVCTDVSAVLDAQNVIHSVVTNRLLTLANNS